MVKRTDPILRQLNEGTGEGFEVRVISEGGRFNINSILMQDDKALLREIFSKWGMELEDAQAVADALGDWVDQDDNVALHGAEKDDYEKAGRVNQPFNRPFYDLSEMRLVRGMDLVEALKPDWREWFTIWSEGPLDVNEAPAELIAAAAEIPVEQADIVPETVRGTDGQRDTEDDVPYQNAAAALAQMGIDTEGRPDIAARFTANANGAGTTRIESIGHAEGATRKIIAIVRNRTGKPALLERTEEILP
jgi:type II secretory pathway component PulK